MKERVSAPAEAIQYFLERVEITSIDSCWIWRLSIGSHGYGQLYWDGKNQTAHRFSHHLFKGDPGRLNVNHTCGNRACCNPAHLYAGTQLENFQDMLRHGTHTPPPHKKGSAVGTSKLTERQAAEIKQALEKGEKGTRLATRFNVSPSTISLIRRGMRWQHVSTRQNHC
jgi:hypothetical protein